MNNTLVTAAKETAELAAPKAKVVLADAATGSSATTFMPSFLSFNTNSLKSYLPSFSAPQWLKSLGNFNATAALESTTASMGNAKDATVKALGDALSAVIPDAIENAAKAHPAVAGFVAGASVVGAVAYRKEIKDGVTAGVSSATAYAKDYAAERFGIGKKKVAPKAPAKEEPAAPTSPAPIPVAVVVSPSSAAVKQPSPPKSEAWGASFLPSFMQRGSTSQPATAAPTKTSPATPGTSPASAASTSTSPAGMSPRKPLIQPDLAKALAATNGAVKDTDVVQSGAKVKKRQRAG